MAGLGLLDGIHRQRADGVGHAAELGVLGGGEGGVAMAAEYSAVSIENVPPAAALHRADGHGETIARYADTSATSPDEPGFGTPGFRGTAREPPPGTVRAVRAAKTCCRSERRMQLDD